MTAWQITAGMQRLELKDGQAEVVFTVSNPGPVDDRATVDVVGSEQADASWFAVAEPQQTVPHGGTKSFQVLVKPTEKASAGTHWLAGRVYSADTAPEENSVTSDRVQFEIAGPAQPKSKLWLWILIAAGIVAVVVGVILFLVLSGDDEPPTTTPQPAVLKTGELEVRLGVGIDADAIGINIDDVDASDFYILREDEFGFAELRTLNNAVVPNVSPTGTRAAFVADCTTEMSTRSELRVNELAEGGTICLRTSQGRVSVLTVTKRADDNPQVPFVLGLSITTYRSPQDAS